MNKSNEELISLIAYGLNITDEFEPSKDIDWTDFLSLSEKHGVLALVLDGIERLVKKDARYSNLLPQKYKFQLLGKVLNLERVYEKQTEVLHKLVSFYEANGIKTLTLKGYGMSLYYPKPSHRACGDIDLYLYGDIDKSDKLLEEKGITIFRDNSHHSTFKIDGIMIENHRTLFDVVIHKSNLRFENIFHKLLRQPQGCIKLREKTLFRPCATLNAIHLIRHAGGDFVFGKIMLRQIVDVCVFFGGKPKIDWQFVLHVFEDEGMMPFYNAMATICVKYFRIPSDCFVGSTLNVRAANVVLNEIFTDTHIDWKAPPSIRQPKSFVSYCYNKTKLLFINKWKYQMVYKESWIEMFLRLTIRRITNK